MDFGPILTVLWRLLDSFPGHLLKLKHFYFNVLIINKLWTLKIKKKSLLYHMPNLTVNLNRVTLLDYGYYMIKM